MDKGWIKLYRQIQDNALWQDGTPFDKRSAWIDLIMMANVQTKQVIYKGQALTINRGQVYTSTRKLAERWNWSRDKVKRFVKLLENMHMVKHDKRTSNATLLTIVKYGDFQSRPTTDKSTNKSSDKSTNKSTDEPLLKNIKNDKEIKEDSSPTSSEEAAAEEDNFDGMSPDEWWAAWERGEVHADWE